MGPVSPKIYSELENLTNFAKTEIQKGDNCNFDKMCETIIQILTLLNRLSNKFERLDMRETNHHMNVNIKDQVAQKGGALQWAATLLSVGVQGFATVLAFSPASAAMSTPLSYVGQGIEKLYSVHAERKNGKSIDLQHKKSEMDRLQNDHREDMQKTMSRITDLLQSLRQFEQARNGAVRTVTQAA